MLYGMANNNVVIPAERDGALYNFLMGGQDYVFSNIGSAFEITPSTTSFLITLGTGEGVVSGRHVTEETVNGVNSMIQLDANSSGYVVIRVDLTRPAGSEAFLYATPVLSSQDLNNSGTVHDLPLYQYTTNANGVSAFTDIRPLSSGSNVVCALENDTIYVEQWVDNVKVRKQVGGETVGTWINLYSNSTSNGSAMSYTTTQDYKGLLVFWSNSVNVTVSKTCAYDSGVKSIPLYFTCKVRYLLGVPSGTVITHPTYDSSTSNGYLRIYSILE